MCSLTPSVTLYGTTQIRTNQVVTNTAFSTYLGDPAVSLTTITQQCDIAVRECAAALITSAVTVRPTLTATVTNVVTTNTVITSIVPQRTLYYPCAGAATGGTQGGTTNSRSTATGGSDLDGFSTFQTGTRTGADQTQSPSTSGSSSASTATASSRTSDMAGPAVISSINPTQPLPSISGETRSMSTSRPIVSSSSSSMHTAGADQSSGPTSSKSHGGMIAGIIVGVVLGLLILCVGIAYFRRNRIRDDEHSEAGDPYWERHFRQLEADGTGPKAEGGSPDGEEAITPKQLRLTLDLQSKGMNTRPASRLSFISAFFARPQPIPFQPGQTARTSKPFNFSRPRFGHALSASASRASTRGSVSGISRTSHKSRDSNKANRASRASMKSISTWLEFGAGAVGTHGSRLSPMATVESGALSTEGQYVGDHGERKGMEWIRTVDQSEMEYKGSPLFSARESVGEAAGIISSPERVSPGRARTVDIGQGNSATPESETSPPNIRQLTPPKQVKRSKEATSHGLSFSSSSNPVPSAVSNQAMKSPASFTQSAESCWSNPSAEWSPGAIREMFSMKDDVPPLPPLPRLSTYQGREESSSSASHTSTLRPSPSFKGQRQSKASKGKGKMVPELHLSRDALTPSLWIDEDIYDRFRRDHSSLKSRNSVQTQKGERKKNTAESRFSAHTTPPVSAVTTNQRESVYGGITHSKGDVVAQPISSASTFNSSGVSEETTSSSAVRTERSAVTPQLPVVTFGEMKLGFEDWTKTTGLEEREERMVSVYQRE